MQSGKARREEPSLRRAARIIRARRRSEDASGGVESRLLGRGRPSGHRLGDGYSRGWRRSLGSEGKGLLLEESEVLGLSGGELAL